MSVKRWENLGPFDGLWGRHSPADDAPCGVDYVLATDYDALLQANRDCVAHFEAIKADYDALQAEVARLKAVSSAARKLVDIMDVPLSTRDTIAEQCAWEALEALLSSPTTEGGRNEP